MHQDAPLRRYGPITTRFGALGSMYPCLQMVIHNRDLRAEWNVKLTPDQIDDLDTFYLSAVRNVELAVADGRSELPGGALNILDDYLLFAASPAAIASTQQAVREQLARAEQCKDQLQAFARSHYPPSEA